MEVSLQRDWHWQQKESSILADSQQTGQAGVETSDAHFAFDGNSNVEVRSSTACWTVLSLRADSAVLDPVEAFVCHILSDVPEQLRTNLGLALHELLENAIEHGCAFDPEQRVDFSFLRTARMVQFQIRDSGRGFSLQGAEHAALSNPPSHPLKHVEYRFSHGMRPGGYGILLAKRIADELIYNEQGNEVVFIKYL